MKFLQELVRFNRFDAENDLADEYADTEVEDFSDAPPPAEDNITNDREVEGDGELLDDELIGDEDTDPDVPLEDVEPLEPEDPNRQGMVRTVKGAHLVYKREVEDGTYEELWQYNTSTLRDEITVRKAILAGTDIPVNKAQSPDGSQSFETWAAGNAELMLIRGLQQ